MDVDRGTGVEPRVRVFEEAEHDHRRELLAGTLTALLCVVQRGSSGVQPKQAPKRLIFVPGRSRQGRDSAALMESEWIAALREGARKLGRALPIDLEIVLPYYGDKFDWFITKEKAPLASDIQARAEPEDRAFLIFQAKIAEELRVRAQITDDQVNAEYGSNRMPRGPLNRWWVQATLRALEKYGAGMTRNTIETFTRDVFLYATRPGIRDEIHRIASKQLTGAPTVIVGHWLGSVVAYNILCTDGGALQVPLFVTLGFRDPCCSHQAIAAALSFAAAWGMVQCIRHSRLLGAVPAGPRQLPGDVRHREL